MKLGHLLAGFPSAILACLSMNAAARPMLLQDREIHSSRALHNHPRGLPLGGSPLTEAPENVELKSLKMLADVFLETNLLTLSEVVARLAGPTQGATIQNLANNVYGAYSRLNTDATALKKELDPTANHNDFGLKIQPTSHDSFTVVIKQLCYMHAGRPAQAKRANGMIQAMADQGVHHQLESIKQGAHWRQFKVISEAADNVLLDLIDLCNTVYGG